MVLERVVGRYSELGVNVTPAGLGMVPTGERRDG
jgi:hypothetical protein